MKKIIGLLFAVLFSAGLYAQEKQESQDGRILLYDDYNIRVSSQPNVYGEKFVLRLLKKNMIIIYKMMHGIEMSHVIFVVMVKNIKVCNGLKIRLMNHILTVCKILYISLAL